jgi:hypothetical protein
MAPGWRRQRMNVRFKEVLEAAGHVNPNVTRAVYRHQISDTVTRAPAALDQTLAAGVRHDPLAPS